MKTELLCWLIIIATIILGVWLTYTIATSDLPLWLKFILLK